MFKKMKNIETAFQYVRMVSVVVILGVILICAFVTSKCFKLANATQGRIYVLVNGKALEAYATDRKDNIPVEAKDHIKSFHQYFFSLSPDEKAIQANLVKALYLADISAKKQYDDLKERNYYSNIISGNVNQTILIDSIQLDINQYPFYFRCFARQELTRPTSIVLRSLITEGYLRNISRSENNSHGFLIERWSTLENRDLNVKNRVNR
ncbi:MAG: conjugative transposon protein TraK [Sphingobacteriales bacterium]|nr:conjugative transposon protein TraK [Sphingobacteriales bacterium]OJV98827.1 MAG: conjugative transposon protein TraK [Sphingobacteriales bacterium 44-61]